jgi:large subunit ribosomal protein L22
MEFTAKLNYVRVSPQKARLVLDMIKGRRAEEALDTLLFTKKGIAPALYKLLRSAVENANYVSAEKGLDVDVDRLYVTRAIANEGPRMKRIRPAPMGRAYRYQRRIAHIEIALAEKTAKNGKGELVTKVGEPEAAPKGKKAAAKKAPAKKSAAKKAPAKKKFAGKKPVKRS